MVPKRRSVRASISHRSSCWMMPDRNGFEVLEELKTDPATQAIPVVIHTSRTLRQEDEMSLAGRHAAVLTKHSADREQALALIARAC